MAKEDARIQWFAVIGADGSISKPVEEAKPPDRIIHVIVNPQFLKDTAQMGNSEAQRALKKIEQWRTDGELKEVNISGWAASRTKDLLGDLRLDLPYPDSSFQVDVCGVNTDVSNIVLLYELRRAGYTAKFSKIASCAGRTEPPQMVINHILDEFPDFLD